MNPPQTPHLSAIRRLGGLAALLLLTTVAQGQGDEKPWWSLQPLGPGAIPTLAPSHALGARNPVDAFLLSGLRSRGLEPSPSADRRTLIRRVTFDLTGLPPTPDEIAAFLADARPDAYERLVDRLLASPHFGERWARHWMDLVHYAETHGHDQDRPRPNAWPYRDYLTDSLNSDKPYARFVQEQLAGDVLFPEDPRVIPALGLLATGPWDESSLRDIREDAIDRQIARYLDRDDMVTTAMSTFVSTTVHCARCHDHKFDPISQEDYYALQAVFAGVDKAERTYDTETQVAVRRRALTREKARLHTLQGKADSSLLGSTVQSQVAAWERSVAATVQSWVPLDPISTTSAHGSTLTRQPDYSVLAGGKRPEKDTYTIKLSIKEAGITGLRLEVLTDESLPQKGPGRQENGNLHLNEIEVTVAPQAKPDAVQAIKLVNPTADFNQDGWTVAMAVDGNPATAWGIYPKVGVAHRAIFEFAEPVGFAEGATLRVVLHQTHGGGHLIGRVRLSVTKAARPLTASKDVLPDAIAAALTVPAAKRTDVQRAALALHVLQSRVERDLASLPAPQMVYAAASDFKPDGSFKPAGMPRPVNLLKRGDIHKPGALIPPGALSGVEALPGRFTLDHPTDEGARRAALARWVTDPRNPLTWRSIANRLWHHHFGRGLVDTPNDFGRMGSKPTHPELLDWLAHEIRDGSGRLKALHRLMVTSAAYRQSSGHNAQAAAVDADNRALWRMNRLRLDAEQIRDAVLLTAGRLDRRMGGPSMKQFHMSPGIHVTPNVDYLTFDVDRAENARRSVYRFVFRTLPDPFMEALDCPDASQLTPARTVSLTALQALAMWNDKFMVRMSHHLAARAEREAKGIADQVSGVYRHTLGREPTTQERTVVADYARRHGLANACRLLLNTNEFLFVD